VNVRTVEGARWPVRRRVRAIGVFLAAVLAISPALAISPHVSQFLRATASLEDSSVRYSPGYMRIAYPLGDVPANIGVCADVVVRAYRKIGIDLQKLVHEDMARNFSAYPKVWGLKHPDSNIDHRRVLNLAVFFKRHGKTLKITNNPGDYKPGDIVTWNLQPHGSMPHIGIVVAQRSADGKRPLVMNNLGQGQINEDILFAFAITGHYRYAID
jgi:uncharacterized protein YijF (DUF1287 family)